MKLIFMGDEIACLKAEKDETAGTVTAFSDNGTVVFQAVKVTDFSLFVLEDGEWTEESAADQIRAKRKELLAETDWTQVLDAPISAESREAMRVYRQALRDITEQEGFPEAVEWPVTPEIVKAEPDPVDEAVDILLGGDEDEA